MKYMWIVEVNEEKAEAQGITPSDVTVAIESLGDDVIEVIEILQDETEK